MIQEHLVYTIQAQTAQDIYSVVTIEDSERIVLQHSTRPQYWFHGTAASDCRGLIRMKFLGIFSAGRGGASNAAVT